MFHTPAHHNTVAPAVQIATDDKVKYTSNQLDAVRRREADVGYDELTDEEKRILDSQE